MIKKKYISPRRKQQKTKKVWLFSGAVIALFIAVIAGALLERYFGYHGVKQASPIIANAQEQEQNRRLILESVQQLGTQLADLRVKYDSLEKLSAKLSKHFGLEQHVIGNLESLKNKESVGDAPMEELPTEDKMSKSAEEIGKELDTLLQKISQQEDDLQVMEFLYQIQAAGLERLPTSMPVSLVQARMTSGFGMRRHPVTGGYRLHAGVDFAGPIGTPIYAPSAGIVSYAGYKSGYGNTVEIDHGNDIMTRYAHNSEILVKEGDLILRKQMIARIGNTGQSTGPHLHFETRVRDVAVDPMQFLGRDFSIGNPQRQSLFESLGVKGSAIIGVGGGTQLQKLGK